MGDTWMIENLIVHMLSGGVVFDMECGDVSPPGGSGDTPPHSKVEPFFREAIGTI